MHDLRRYRPIATKLSCAGKRHAIVIDEDMLTMSIKEGRGLAVASHRERMLVEIDDVANLCGDVLNRQGHARAREVCLRDLLLTVDSNRSGVCS
jgi:hypothetical protein